MPKTCCFSTSIFSGFGLDFGASWASKSAALLAAPGVLDPTVLYACINILHFLTRGGPTVPKCRSKLRMLGPCKHYVGAFFGLGRLFVALGRLLRVCWAFFAHVGCFFFAFGATPGGKSEHPNTMLERPKRPFSMFLARAD